MNDSIPYQSGVADIPTRNALIGLKMNKPISVNSIQSIDVRRIVTALDRKRRLKFTGAIPSVSSVKDAETKRILRMLKASTT